MSEQWTKHNPGAGSANGLTKLAEKLESLEKHLDAAVVMMDRAAEVYDSSWVGSSAAAAEGATSRTKSNVQRILEVLPTVPQAIRSYLEDVGDVSSLAAIEIAARDSAIAQYNKQPGGIGDPNIKAVLAANDAIAQLAERRATADSTLMQALRSAIVYNWDVAPEDFPSERGDFQFASYEYVQDHELNISVDDMTAEELMEYFKKYPKEVFPFPVSGSSDIFEDGAVFTLSDTIAPGVELPFEEGVVAVTTTPTSVKFTVISDEYFDGPGSTIEFSIVEVDGSYVLRKEAVAVDAEMVVAGGVNLPMVGASNTWSEQALRLMLVVEKYRKK